MKKIKKDLLVVYLNEFNLDFLQKGAKKYNCESILKILKLKNLKTFTRDKKQDFNLDPWVQSVSINTGKSSKQHNILRLGQPLKKNQIQIWDKLSKNKVTCAVWGAMNSKLKKNKYIQHYFPDPWNFRDSTTPKNLMGLYYLPNYYAKNYLKFSLFKFSYFSLIFFFTLIFKINLLTFLKDLFFSLKLLLVRGFKNFILFFFFDQIFLNIFQKTVLKKKSSFSFIFLNSIAHYQHNNWNEIENEKYFFLYAESIFKKILNIKNSFNSFLIFNGFTQKKIPIEYLLRPKNPKKFLLKFINFERLEQDMTNGGFIFFKNRKNKDQSVRILNKLYCFGSKIFYIKKYNSNKLFYKINLKSNKTFKELNFNKVLLKKNLIQNLKFKKIKNDKKIDISEYFIKNIKFIKTTGIHVPEGLVLFDNFKHFNKVCKIENHKIFSLVCKHFETY